MDTFSESFHKYFKPLVKFATWLLFQDDLAAEDIVAEIFIEIHEKGLPVTEPFLYLCVRRRCYSYLDHIKRKKLRHKKYMYFQEDVYLERKLERAETWHNLSLHLNKLPESQREMLILAYAMGLSGREIAELRKTTENTVRNTCFRALRELRKQVKNSL